MKKKCEFCGKEYGILLRSFKMHYSLTKKDFCICKKCRNEYGKEIKKSLMKDLAKKNLVYYMILNFIYVL